MFRVNGSIILAFAGLVLIGVQNPAKQPQETFGNQQTQTRTKPSAASPPETPKPSYQPYADRYADSCYNANDHDSADLCAQWRAAFAAERAATEARRATTWAIVAALLSFIGVGGLIYTIWQTHGALGEARRGNRLNLLFEKRARREAKEAAVETGKALAVARNNARSAKQHVSIAKDSAERQLRAYVSIVELPGGRLVAGEEIEFPFSLVNRGQTPAHNVSFAGTAFVRPKEWIFIDGGIIDEVGRPNLVIPPSGKFNVLCSSGVILSQDIWNNIMNGSAIAYVSGIAYYDDCFGNPCETSIRARYEASDGRADGKIALCAEGNSMT